MSSLGKFLAVGGMILAKWPQPLIIGGTVLAVLMTAFGFFKHFVTVEKKEKKVISGESKS